jgi:hypothetical protein
MVQYHLDEFTHWSITIFFKYNKPVQHKVGFQAHHTLGYQVGRVVDIYGGTYPEWWRILMVRRSDDLRFSIYHYPPEKES